MNELASTELFERSMNRLTANDLWRRAQIDSTLELMKRDLNTPELEIHHLKGSLKGLDACRVSSDCWIVFAREKGRERLILLNIGSHSEVF